MFEIKENLDFMMPDGLVTVEINTLALLEFILTGGLAQKYLKNRCYILQIRSSQTADPDNFKSKRLPLLKHSESGEKVDSEKLFCILWNKMFAIVFLCTNSHAPFLLLGTKQRL